MYQLDIMRCCLCGKTGVIEKPREDGAVMKCKKEVRPDLQNEGGGKLLLHNERGNVAFNDCEHIFLDCAICFYWNCQKQNKQDFVDIKYLYYRLDQILSLRSSWISLCGKYKINSKKRNNHSLSFLTF